MHARPCIARVRVTCPGRALADARPGAMHAHCLSIRVMHAQCACHLRAASELRGLRASGLVPHASHQVVGDKARNGHCVTARCYLQCPCFENSRVSQRAAKSS